MRKHSRAQRVRIALGRGARAVRLEVLRLLSRGKTNREIARDLGLSALTVKTYVQRIIGKLGVSDRTQAAVRAAELGLLSPESA